MAQETIEVMVKNFKQELRRREASQVYSRYILHGTCFALSEDQYWHLRQSVSDRFDIPLANVLVVGSGKLGFSIAPTKRFRPFGDTSDVDVVVVSENLFDSVWVKVHKYCVDGGYWDQIHQFQKYLFNGWIRPDMLPPPDTFQQTQEWWDFFQSLSASREYGLIKITGALYRNWYFLQEYQLRGIKSCIDSLRED